MSRVEKMETTMTLIRNITLEQVSSNKGRKTVMKNHQDFWLGLDLVLEGRSLPTSTNT